MGFFDRMQIALYRRTGGADPLTRMWDFPVVLLTTKGATSGRTRTTALGGFADGDDAWLVFAAGVTVTSRHPAWFLNMVRNPDDIWLEAGRRKTRVRARSLAGAERTEALQRIAAISPRYAKYQSLTDREIPLVLLTA